LLGWYAADQLAGLSDGDGVATWPDLSGNGNTLTASAAGGSVEPVYVTGVINGFPVVRFDLNSFLTATVGSLTAQPVSAYFILNNPGGGRWGSFGTGIRFGQGNAALFYSGGGFSGGTLPSGLSRVGMVVNGASSVIRANGAVTTGNGSGNGPGQEICVGSEGDNAQQYQGDIAEVMFYGTALTAQELEALDGYAYDKYVNAPLAVTTPEIGGLQFNIPFTATLAASGGETPYTWLVTAGSLPAGLSLNASTGVLSGTPSRIETYSFTVQAADAYGETATAPFTGSVLPPGSSSGAGGGVMGYDLLSTLQQAAAYQEFYDTTLPVACPRDGTPFREGPPDEPGVLYCPFCFFQYPRDWDASSMSGM
jgi:hypothetical protein